MDRRTVKWTITLGDGTVYGGSIATKARGMSKGFNPSIRLLALDYERRKEKKGQIKFRFYNEDLAYFTSPCLMKGTQFECSFGYADQSSEVYSAVVTGVRGFREIEVEATLEENEFSYLPKVMKWENTSRSQIAKTIAQESGFALADVDEVAETRTFLQQNQTDREFLLSLAEDLNFQVFTRLENGFLTLHFHAKRKSDRPFWRLTWRGGEGNLKDFNITENSILGVPGEVEVAGYDPDTREELRATSQPKKDALASFSEVLSIAGKTGETFDALLAGKDAMRKAKSVLPKPLADLLDAQNQANVEGESVLDEIVKATASIVGEPSFEAGQVVELAGLPEMLAGNWWVEQVKHTIGESGFSTELGLTRDSVGELPMSPEEWNASAGFPNKKAAQAYDLQPIEAIDTKTGEIYKVFRKDVK